VDGGAAGGSLALYRVLGTGKIVFPWHPTGRDGVSRSSDPSPMGSFGGLHRPQTRQILSVMPDIHDFPKHDLAAARSG